MKDNLLKAESALKNKRMRTTQVILVILLAVKGSSQGKAKSSGFFVGRIPPSALNTDYYSIQYPELDSRMKPNDAMILCEAGQFLAADIIVGSNTK